jgi:hypothetical protein
MPLMRIAKPARLDTADHGGSHRRSQIMTLNKFRKLLGGAISLAGAVVLVAQHF